MHAAPAASESIRPRAIVCSGREKSLGLRPISSRRGRSTRTMASMWVTVASFTTRASQTECGADRWKTFLLSVSPTATASAYDVNLAASVAVKWWNERDRGWASAAIGS